jgi:hypothetical protein
MEIGTVVILVGVVVLMMSLFWILSRPRRGTVVRDEYY